MQYQVDYSVSGEQFAQTLLVLMARHVIEKTNFSQVMAVI